MKRTVLIILSLMICTGAAMASDVFNVRDFGAKGDGTTLDTQAIQAAVDAAYEAGGGEVLFEAGTYLSGSIRLRDNIDFHLTAGAVLKGSSDISDYCDADVVPQNYASSKSGDNTSGGHLVYSANAHGVTLRGPGCIDGNSRSFLLDGQGKAYVSKQAIEHRPAQMIWMVDCSDVRIQDLEIANAPYWSCFIHNCQRVWVRGCYIHTERELFHTFNGDGLDIDRCQYVEVSDCRIDTEDDCITLRASGAKRLESPMDCAYVTVTNCNLSTTNNAIRVGVGEGRIHDAVFTGITISDTQKVAFNFVSSYGPNDRGTDITDIRISNVMIDAREFLRMHHMYSTEGLFRNIIFDGISGRVEDSENGVIMRARKTRPFENIVFRNVDLDCQVDAVGVSPVIHGGGLTMKKQSKKQVKNIEEDMAALRNLLH